MQTKIENSSIILRKLRRGDEECLAKHANDYLVAKYLKDSFPYPYTLSDARHWIEFASHPGNGHFLAIEVDQEVIGCIGVEKQKDVFQKSAELGYWIGSKYWNRGIMTHVVRQMVDYSFSSLEIVRLYAQVFESNIGSEKVLENAGFVREAVLKKAIYKNGQFLDLLIYAIVKE